MKRYLKIYLNSDRAYIQKNLHARAALLLQVSGSLCFLFMHLLAMSFLLPKFKFPGWSTPQIWILMATFEIYTYSCFHLFNRGVRYTVRDINFGTFDIIMSKPINTRFLAFFRGGSVNNFAALLTSIGVLTYFLFHYSIHITLLNLLLYVLFLLLSIWFLHCLSIFFVVPNFFSGNMRESETGTFAFQEIYKYPAQTFDKPGSNSALSIFTLVFSLLTTIPASAILTKNLSIKYWAIYLGSLILITILSQRAWNHGLKNYSSSG